MKQNRNRIWFFPLLFVILVVLMLSVIVLFPGIPRILASIVLLLATAVVVILLQKNDRATLLRRLLTDKDLKNDAPISLSDAFIARLTTLAGTEQSPEQANDYISFQQQINPHFLYNTLESIRSEALLCGNLQIANMTERLARFFRYSIFGRGDILTIGDELKNVSDYFYIQQYRFGDRFELVTDIEDDTVLDAEIPKMTFQPIVENAIFHGLEQNLKKGRITIRIYHTDLEISVIISDNGSGMDTRTLEQLRQRLKSTATTVVGNHGIALPNVYKRLKMHFGDKYGLEIHSVFNVGTDVEIRVPYILNR